MKKLLYFAVLFLFTACGGDGNQNLNSSDASIPENDGVDHIYASIVTSKGNILIDLAYNHAPMTVANFIMLSEGLEKTKYTERGEPLYDGLTFHRVVPNFIIQGGDPLANGLGGPGYKFKDEFSSLRHDRPGTLSMANSGPDSNGSQFFITLAATPHLDGRHSVFGYVIDGQNVVERIGQGDIIEHIQITRVGETAENFDALKVFRSNMR